MVRLLVRVEHFAPRLACRLNTPPIPAHTTLRERRVAVLPDGGGPGARRFSIHEVWVMLIVHVHVRVKPEFVDAFKQATIENARASAKEPGIARFDVIQQSDDPTRFVLVEVYRSEEATTQHKETAHYAAWRDAAEPMLAEARTRVRYSNTFPPDEGW